MWHIYKPHSIWCANQNWIQLRTFDSALNRMHLIYLLTGCLRLFSYFTIIIRCLALKASSCLSLSPSLSLGSCFINTANRRMPLTYHNETNTWHVRIRITALHVDLPTETTLEYCVYLWNVQCNAVGTTTFHPVDEYMHTKKRQKCKRKINYYRKIIMITYDNNNKWP